MGIQINLDVTKVKVYCPRVRELSVKTNHHCSICLTVAMLLSVAQFVNASCNLQITSAGPCMSDYSDGIPHVGDDYAVKVSFHVSGTPTNSFRIKFTIANITSYSSYFSLNNGANWNWYFYWTLPLDDSMPWSVTLDPDGVSGNTNLVNSSTNGVFTPIPPSSAVELYSPRLMHGTESLILNLQPDSGNVPYVYVIFGAPTTHGAQNAVSISGSPSGNIAATPPYGDPILEIARTNVSSGTYQYTNRFIMQLSRVRVNPTLLRTNTWADMNSLATNWTQWLAPDPACESTNAAITSFVQQSLPTNYLTTMTPYDTARALHRAVMKALTYQSPPLHGDAVGVLQDGLADCGGFAALLTACLRNVGIPSRCICGFFQGDFQTHIRVEFHLPNAEWLVADPTDGNAYDPSGTYAYYFGFVPNADSFMSMAAGSIHETSFATFGGLQSPGLWFLGGSATFTENITSYLQPDGVLCMTNSANGSLQFYLNDAPTEGSVILQTSTNLTAWSPVVTNSADGTVINFSYPTTNGVSRFYRANVIP